MQLKHASTFSTPLRPCMTNLQVTESQAISTDQINHTFRFQPSLLGWHHSRDSRDLLRIRKRQPIIGNGIFENLIYT